MASEIATAYVRVRPNMAGFKAETESGVKGAFSGVGKIVGLAFGGIVAGEIVKSSVQAAAQVQKSTELIQNKFKGASESVIKFAETTGTNLGAASSSTLAFSAKLGNLLTNMGFSSTAAAAMTKGWEKLGLAFNATTGGGMQGAVDVLSRLQLSATGASTRGLRPLGISLQSSTLQAKAFSEGITQSLTQALTPAQKALVTYQLAMAHMPQLLALAQKHSNDLANVQARLSAHFEQAKVALGYALLPAMVVLANFLSRTLGPAVRGVIAIVTDLKVVLKGAFDFVKPAFEPIVNVVKSIINAFKGGGGITGIFDRLKADFEKLGPAAKVAVVALGGIAAILATLAFAATPFAGVLGVVALGVALGEAYRRSATFRRIVGEIGDYIKGTLAPIFEGFGKSVAGLYAKFYGTIIPALERAGKAVVSFFKGAATGGGVFESIINALERAGQAVVKFFRSGTAAATLRTAISGLGAAARAVAPIFAGIGRVLVYGFQHSLPVIQDLGRTLKTEFTDALPIIKEFARVIGVVFVVAVKIAQTVWKHFGGTITQIAKSSFGVIIATIRGALEVIRGIFDIFSGILTGNWSKMWKGVKEILGGALHALTAAIKGWGEVVKQFFIDLWHTIEKIVLEGIDKVVSRLAAIPTSFKIFGHTFGFTNPFKGVDESLKNTIAGLSQVGKQAIAVEQNVRDNVGKGITKGVTKATSDPATKAALKKTTDTASKTLADGLTQGVQNGVGKAMPGVAKTITDALQNAITSAHKAIVGAVQSAKDNLDKIGQDLAKSIDQIQQKLGGAAGAVAGSPQGKAFEKLKKLIESGAPGFEIAKAQAELNANLQNVGKTQQQQVGSQLSNLTSAFDSGKIGFREFERRLHEILTKDGITMKEALKAGGPAFADAVKAQIAALRQQAKAISDVPKKFRGVGGAGGAADIKIIHPLDVIHQEQQKIHVAEAKAAAAQLKQEQKQTAYTQTMATVGVKVTNLPKTTAGTHVARVHVAAPTTGLPGPGGARTTQRVTPAHITSMTSALTRALARVCSDIDSASKDIVSAELTVRTPIENLRRTEIRIADDAARQRSEMIREGRTTNSLLRRLDRNKGPVPGFNKERPGTGSHQARKAHRAGVKV